MGKVLKHLDNFEEHILAFLLPVMCTTIFVATFSRFTNLFIITWAEELARYCMIWITYFGICAAAKKGEHFCVTIFTEMMPPSLKKIVSVIRMILMIIFTFFVTRYGIVILKSQMNMKQTSPSLFWPMWCVYSVILIGCVLMMIRYTIYGINELKAEKARQQE